MLLIVSSTKSICLIPLFKLLLWQETTTNYITHMIYFTSVHRECGMFIYTIGNVCPIYPIFIGRKIDIVPKISIYRSVTSLNTIYE